MSKLILVCIFLANFICGYSQIECTATVNELYETIPLREYRLDKIEKGYEPSYEKDLKKGESVKVIGIIDRCAVIINHADTFLVYYNLLHSTHLDKYVAEIEYKKKQEIQRKIYGESLDTLGYLESEKILIDFRNSCLKNNIKFFDYIENVKMDKATDLFTFVSNKKINLKEDEIVGLIGYKKDTVYVQYRGHMCYSNVKNFICEKTDSLINILIVQPDQILYAERHEFKKKIINERKAVLISKYGKSAAEAILKGSVYVGMSKEMAREAWGKPLDINTTITSYGRHEQWVYGDGNYLYFDDDKLTTIQH